jgi:hypothetical protein
MKQGIEEEKKSYEIHDEYVDHFDDEIDDNST